MYRYQYFSSPLNTSFEQQQLVCCTYLRAGALLGLTAMGATYEVVVKNTTRPAVFIVSIATFDIPGTPLLYIALQVQNIALQVSQEHRL